MEHEICLFNSKGKRSSRGSTRRSSPAVAGAGVAIAGSKEVERDTARGERRGRSRGVVWPGG